MGFRRLLVGAGALGALVFSPRVLPKRRRDAFAQDKAAIARILNDEGAAWATGDADAFGADAAPGIVFTNIIGMFSVGKAPFVGQHHAIFSGMYQGSTMHQFIEDISFTAPGAAIVSTVCKLAGAREFPPGVPTVDGVLYTRLLQVMVKAAAGWKVAAFHNTIVRPQFVDETMLALTAGEGH